MLYIYWFSTGLLWLIACLKPPQTVQADYEQLIAAELAFAQLALDRGIRTAFVENLDEQSVVFQNNRFLPGKVTYQQRPDGPSKLSWRPTYAEISASGTLGFTTGPYEFRQRSMNDEPVSYGQFTSVWHKTAAGNWKALIDFGSTHSRPDQPETGLRRPTQFANKVSTTIDTSAAGRELEQVERAFGLAARSQSLWAAYQLMWPATDSIRLLREGEPVRAGAAVKTLAASSEQKVDYQLIRVVVSPAGDLGYSYGYAIVGQNRQGYLRIWRMRNKTWQLAHEVIGLKLS